MYATQNQLNPPQLAYPFQVPTPTMSTSRITATTSLPAVPTSSIPHSSKPGTAQSKMASIEHSPFLSSSSSPLLSSASSSAVKGLKRFFSRTRSSNSETLMPHESLLARLRFKALVLDSDKNGTSFKYGRHPGPKQRAQPELINQVESPKEIEVPAGAGQQLSSFGINNRLSRRPSCSDAGKGSLRLAASVLPAMQRRADGRWQAPSLSRGSISTSALQLFAETKEEEDLETVGELLEQRTGSGEIFLDQTQDSRPGPQDLSTFPQLGTEDLVKPVETNGSPRTKLETSLEPLLVDAADDQGKEDQPVRKSRSPALSPSPSLTPKAKPVRGQLRGIHTTISKPRVGLGESLFLIPSHYTQLAGLAKGCLLSNGDALSREHQHLRISTILIVQILASLSANHSTSLDETEIKVQKTVLERLESLARMKDDWDGECSPETSSSKVSVSASAMDDNLSRRMKMTGEKMKIRERRTFMNALKDGVLLCFLFNTLFPKRLPQIVRINTAMDSILQTTNLAKFITACELVGLSRDELCNLSDLQDNNVAAVAKVTTTIITLFQKAEFMFHSGEISDKHPDTVSALNLSPLDGAPAIDSMATPRKSRSTRRDNGVDGSPTPRPKTFARDRSTSIGGTFNFFAKLDIGPTTSSATTRKTREDSEDLDSVMSDSDVPADSKTPTNSAFSLAPVTPQSPDDEHLVIRGHETRPRIAPMIMPKFPFDTSSESISPSSSSRQLLRPRNATASNSQLARKFSQSSLWRNEIVETGSSRELVLPNREPVVPGDSSRSQYWSQSLFRGPGREEDTALDLADDEEDIPLGRGRSGPIIRRLSERTLHDARKQIIRTLLSTEDLSTHLQATVMEQGSEDPRGVAISQSLASLEGRFSLRSREDSNPRKRVSLRRGSNTEITRQEVSCVAEEEEGSDENPVALRRASVPGKIFIPKRSARSYHHGAPSVSSSSPTTGVFSISSRTLVSDGESTAVSRSSPIDSQIRTKIERRQSDGFGYAHRQLHSGTEISSLTSLSERGIGQASHVINNSMVNLSTSLGHSMFIRESREPLPILEFKETGLLPVKYQLGNCVGRGQFGAVYRSLNLSSGQMVAIKRINLKGMTEEEVGNVMKEVEVLRSLSHPGIVKYEGMSREEEYLNIVLEFVENGSLGQTLKAFGKFNETLVASYVAKILEGLEYLHSQGVVHCDLKAANILSTKNGNIKLSDFGVSLNLKAMENIKHEAMTASKLGGKMRNLSEVAGTPHWMAPEVIELNGASFASDIWSLGCTIIELLTGKPPYSDLSNGMTVLFRIVEDEMPPIPEVSGELADFLEKCFIKKPCLRPSAAVLFQHPWVRKHNPEIIRRPLDSVPFLRRLTTDVRRIESSCLFPDVDSPPHDQSSASTSMIPEASSVETKPGSSSKSSSSEEQMTQSADPVTRHHMIKTSFSKAIVCRVCHSRIKKSGVICKDCGLLCHGSCVTLASPHCSLSSNQSTPRSPSRQSEKSAQSSSRMRRTITIFMGKEVKDTKSPKKLNRISMPGSLIKTGRLHTGEERRAGMGENRQYASGESELQAGSMLLRSRNEMASLGAVNKRRIIRRHSHARKDSKNECIVM